MMNTKARPTNSRPAPCEACGGRFTSIRDIYETYQQCMNCGRTPEQAEREAERRRQTNPDTDRKELNPVSPPLPWESDDDQPAVVADDAREDPRNAIAAIRWPSGVSCPDCGSTFISASDKIGGWKCESCAASFTALSHSPMARVGRTSREWLKVLRLTAQAGAAITPDMVRNTCGIRSEEAGLMAQQMQQAMSIAGCKQDGPLTAAQMSLVINTRDPETERAVRSGIQQRREQKATDQKAEATRQAESITEPAAAPENAQTECTDGAAATPDRQHQKAAAEQPADQKGDKMGEMNGIGPANGAARSNEAQAGPTGMETRPGKAEENSAPEAGTQQPAPQDTIVDTEPAPAPAPEQEDQNGGTEGPADRSGTAGQLEAWRWPDGPWCTRCGSERITNAPPSAAGTHRCRECNQVFSVRHTSPLSRSRIDDDQWERAIRAIIIGGERLSATALAEKCGSSVADARNMNRRLKTALTEAQQSADTDTPMVTRVMNAMDPRTGKHAAPRQPRPPQEADPSADPPHPSTVPDPETPETMPAPAATETDLATKEPPKSEPARSPQGGLEQRLSLVERQVEHLSREAANVATQAVQVRIVELLTDIRDRLSVNGNGMDHQAGTPCPKCRAATTTEASGAMRCWSCGCVWRE